MAKAGVIERVRRGVVSITNRGKELLIQGHPKITVKLLTQFPEFKEFHSPERSADEEETKAEGSIVLNFESETPEERLEASYTQLQSSLAVELLDAVKKCSPQFFENLVVRLLVAMGYGGSIKDAGRAIGGPGDEGVDGIIKEDRLGLDVVYVQAKRWANSNIGRPEVQAFVGSLEGHRAQKGIIITTTGFSEEAKTYVQKIGKRIVLIDGKQLAEYMIEHNLGVTVTKIYQVKRLDMDFFEID